MKKDTQALIVSIIPTITLAIGAILILLMFWIVPSYFEATTYSRLTGRNVSTWDALWVELRVIEPARLENTKE